MVGLAECHREVGNRLGSGRTDLPVALGSTRGVDGLIGDDILLLELKATVGIEETPKNERESVRARQDIRAGDATRRDSTIGECASQRRRPAFGTGKLTANAPPDKYGIAGESGGRGLWAGQREQGQ